MKIGTRPLFFLVFFPEVVRASTWTVEVPSTVEGLPGSCVVIPCSFNYPDPPGAIGKFTGIWMEAAHHPVYHPVGSKIMQEYLGRTELVGDVRHKNCSLKIDPLRPSDRGPFHFRVELKSYQMFSYKDNTVSINMAHTLSPVKLTVTENAADPTLTASCSVTHSCPASPPVFFWSHSGRRHEHSRPLVDGQWEATSTLTLHPAHANNDSHLLCHVKFKGGQRQEASRIINVQYAPVNVAVDYEANVQEGGAVRLRCSSDANPPASSYEWQNDRGAQLHRGGVFILTNVSRHADVLYCVAVNAVGRATSSPVRLDVTHAPEIRSVSGCSSDGETVKCVCIAESRPPGDVRFLLADAVLPGPAVERHGAITIGTLRASLPPAEFVYCVANNTVGSASAAIALPVRIKMLYFYITAAGAAVIVTILFIVIVKQCRARRRDAPSPDPRRQPGNSLQTITGARKNIACCATHSNRYSDHVYGNMYEAESIDCQPVYANL
ncbi:sialic acid-binding Ig-like lectin 14 [Syngnathoides biaculeatus]|uniref:sialic acid-binding Ig-like lectin 14 n=1 Tax=Syngnathoides biaculeatus TaxID=300417 RepID=UPI002ADDAF3D|nr:sialic acid-binding Ig-like lectin 14 [Syngnathoides biaculeatus]